MGVYHVFSIAWIDIPKAKNQCRYSDKFSAGGAYNIDIKMRGGKAQKGKKKMRNTTRSKERYEALETVARKEGMTVMKFSKMIVMEYFELAGYSGNDEWFDQFTDEAFVNTVCDDYETYELTFPELFSVEV